MNTESKTRSMIMTGMFTAVIAVLSQIAIPMPSGVPITLQTFGVALTGCVLGWKLGGVAAFIYLLVGAVGVPVYSNFTGGVGRLLGPTGGFIVGFIALAVLCGIGAKLSNRAAGPALSLLGLIICHLVGAGWYAISAGTSFASAFLAVSLPYLLKDALSVILAYLIAQTLVKRALRAGIRVRA